jgi:hypothetical protein
MSGFFRDTVFTILFGGKAVDFLKYAKIISGVCLIVVYGLQAIGVAVPKEITDIAIMLGGATFVGSYNSQNTAKADQVK